MKGQNKNKNLIKPVGSREARRIVGMILEVMAGTMGVGQAAETLSISIPKYYMLESRALDGMLAACEPRPKGYVKTPERELAALKRTHAKLERECARYQALARAAHRTVGLRLPKNKDIKTKKGKRRRKPTVRALTIAKRLQEQDKQTKSGVSDDTRSTSQGAEVDKEPGRFARSQAKARDSA